MKRNIDSLILTLMMLLSACTSEIVTTTVQESPQARQLTFAVTVPLQATRGADITDENLTSFGLMGVLQSTPTDFSNTASAYIDNGEVQRGTKTFVNTDYSWPNTNYASFFAYAPYNPSGLTAVTTTAGQRPFLSYSLPTNAADQADIIVARAEGEQYDPDNAVALAFDHICAKLLVKVGPTYRRNRIIKSVSFTKVKYSADYYYDSGWQTPGSVTKDIVLGDLNVKASTSPNTMLTSDTYQFMVIPQDINGMSELVVEYSDGTTDAQLVKGLDGVNTWLAGESYTYTVKQDVVEWDFDYTGAVQTFTAPYDGIYQIECWGASGGNSLENGRSYDNRLCLGGYSAGSIYLDSGQELFVYVGERGKNAVIRQHVSGGWNGGGKGCDDDSDDEAGGGGGGATDVRLVKCSTGDAVWDEFASIKTRIIVAGGGGGGSWFRDQSSLRGYGGGLSGGDVGSQTKGGTQKTGNKFGRGADATAIGGSDGSGGGGGGWYGGYVLPNNGSTSNGNGCGAGGSGFVSGLSGCNAIDQEKSTSYTTIVHTNQPNYSSDWIFSNAKSIPGNENMTSPEGTTEKGHYGNGYCRISLVKKI